MISSSLTGVERESLVFDMASGFGLIVSNSECPPAERLRKSKFPVVFLRRSHRKGVGVANPRRVLGTATGNHRGI